MLLHIADVLTRDELSRIRQALETTDWADGRETVGTQGAQVKRNQQLPDASPLKAELGKLVLAALERSPLFFAAALPLKILPPRFNRYSGGGEYGFHVDGAVMSLGGGGGGGGGVQLRSDVSCTLFLSEPDEYDGGYLVVSDTYGEHEVKLPAGDLIVYPSSSLHKVTPVTRGARLASFFWVQSMVREDSRRGELYSLDQTIQALRARLGESPEGVRLTAHYHNLLRMWAEV
ncbi:MAG: Fe2+-dependent dioxygenase [Steroidobacteraceae bacterium]